jgi:hypothetical protein
MTDREKRPDKSATRSNPATRGDQAAEPHHPDLGERADPDSEKSTTARPRGHTEEPDRTL